MVISDSVNEMTWIHNICSLIHLKEAHTPHCEILIPVLPVYRSVFHHLLRHSELGGQFDEWASEGAA